LELDKSLLQIVAGFFTKNDKQLTKKVCVD